LLSAAEALFGGRGTTTRPPIPPVASAPVPATQPKPEEVKPVPIPDDYFKEGLKFLKGRLIAGMEPETIINWVFDNRDDMNYQPFIKEILAKDFEFFAKLDEEIGHEPFRSKFITIYNGIRSLFNEEYGMELDSGRVVGDSPNPSSNGKPS
jgi:hypothetical protein